MSLRCLLLVGVLSSSVRASTSTGKREQLMILALSGTRPKDQGLREGMIAGWANEHTWLVTHAETSWPNVIRLPDEAEQGGYDGCVANTACVNLVMR